MILDGDQVVRNPAALDPVFDHSGYNGVWTDRETGEWLMTAENGIVTSCSRTGGKGGWQLYSVSRWTAEDGAKLRKLLEYEFEENNNRQIWWDNIALTYHKEDFRLGIRPIREGAIVEIDKLEELAEIDPSYRKYLKEM